MCFSCPVIRVGPFSLVREVSRSGLVRAGVARRDGTVTDAASAEVFLKIFDPGVPLARDELRRREAQFLEQAQLQSDLANRSSAWVPVVQAGRAALTRDEASGIGLPPPPVARPRAASLETMIGGASGPGGDALDPAAPARATQAARESAYVALSRFDESVATLRAGRAAVSLRVVSAVADAVVAALETLDAAHGRAHGGLSESNVLLRRAAGSDLLVAVSDPCVEPGVDLAADAAYAADARMLGRLLFGLIEGRIPSRGEAENGLSVSPQFERFGKRGRRLHAACVALMLAGRDGADPLRPPKLRQAVEAARGGRWGLSRLLGRG